MSANINDRLAALPGFPALAGPRVRLRGPRRDDIDDVFALFSSEEVMRHWSSAAMRVRMQAEGKLDEMLEGFERRDSLDWLIAHRRDDRAIGSCTLYRFDSRRRRAEIGYALHPHRWGHGLAAEAVALALDWGFHHLGLQRIEADIDPRNHASRRLLVRLGFQRENPGRQRLLVDGSTIESEIHGLVREDWLARQRR